MRRAPALLALGLAASLSACLPVLVQPTLEDAAWGQRRWPSLTLDELQEGRAIYVRKCAGCHHLHRPQEYDADAWRDLIQKMIEKQEVELADLERERIERFLVSTSLRLRNPTPTADTAPVVESTPPLAAADTGSRTAP